MPTPSELDAARLALREELRSVEQRIAALSAEFDQIVEGSESVNTDDEHDPEGATIAFERAQVASLRDSGLRRREDRVRALAEVEDGTYGRCAACGEPIGAERLDAVPGTDRCASCAGARR